MKNLMFILVIPAVVWLVSCSVVSFIDWHNYFIYTVDQWHPFARGLFMVFSLIGITGYTMVESSDAGPNHL